MTVEEKTEKMVEHIREYGVYHARGKERNKNLFEGIGCPADKKAEYVLLSGCMPPLDTPSIFSALKNFLDHYGVSYTFLSKEYCCGWLPLVQPAIMAKKDEDSIKELKGVAEEFLKENINHAKKLRAKAIVTICAPCEPNYQNLKESAGIEIMHYPEFLARYFEGGKLNLKADYYPGCYRFRRRITHIPFNYGPAETLLSRVEGLELNRLDEKLCCYVPPQAEELVNNIKYSTVVTTCTGCRSSLEKKFSGKDQYQVKLLPEIVWESLRK